MMALTWKMYTSLATMTENKTYNSILFLFTFTVHVQELDSVLDVVM